MAEQLLVVNASQSNGGPFHDLETWLPDRVDLNQIVSTNRVSGAYAPKFTMPFNAPGYSGQRPLKGIAIENIRYLVFYNPIVTGYTSYPGTGRVIIPPAGFGHTSQTVWVEQMFLRGAHAITEVVRKTTARVHTIESILVEKQTFATNFATSTSNLVCAGHGLISGDRVTLITTLSDLPNGLSTAITYWVTYVDNNTVKLSLTNGGAPVTFSDDGTGTHSIVAVFPAGAGCRLKFSTAQAWTKPLPQVEEEFTYKIKATVASVNTTNVVRLNLNFGVRRKTTAKLVGLQIRHVSTGQKLIIDTWNPTDSEASCVDPVTLTATNWTNVAAGSELVIEPQGNVAWDRYAFFLPWTMFESNLSEPIIDKTNPYMPGFDYPSDFHAPQVYGTDSQVPTGVPGTGGLFKRTIAPWISWHVGFLVRLAEHYGRDIWCLSCDFGGTSASHFEVEIGTLNVGWYDRGQQTDWALARKNSCYQRLLDEIDAAKSAAAAVGDTLKVVLVLRNQGFADATSYSDPTYGSSVGQSGASASKFYDTNKAFRARLRSDLVARGLWDGPVAEIPWVQPLEQKESVQLAVIGDAALHKQVNEALQQLSDEDDFAETWDQSGLDTWDGIHFFGRELGKVEEASMQAFQRILRLSDRAGELPICNAALQNLGESLRVTSIRPSDGSVEANLCAEHFDRARDIVLEARNWGFAMRRRPGFMRDSEAPTAWEFCYVRPSDCLRLVKVLPPDATDDEIVTSYRTSVTINFPPVLIGAAPQNHIEETLADGTQVIYTNQPDAILLYVRRVTDTTKWSAKFRTALEAQLTSRIVGALVKGAEGARARLEWEQVAQALIAGAAELDAAQFENPPRHIPSWLAAME